MNLLISIFGMFSLAGVFIALKNNPKENKLAIAILVGTTLVCALILIFQGPPNG